MRTLVLLSLLAAPGRALARQGGPDSEALGRLLSRLREQAARSAVSIDILRDSDPEGQGPTGPSASGRDYYRRPKGPCTGTIVDAEGWIATSWFNVSGGIRRITVSTHDRKAHEAKLAGFDVPRDVAILKIDAKDLPVLSVAAPADLCHGTFCAVIGRAPDPEVPTITCGILSATNRFKNSAVQTDAEMNYGNAGGPLVTLEGRLIGVTNHIKPTEAWGQSGGIGFAVKTDLVVAMLEKLKKGEKVAVEKILEPWLGIVPGDGVGGVEGVEIAQVIPGHGAEAAGLQPGDVLVEFDGTPVVEVEELKKLVQARKIGDEVGVKLKRKGDGGKWEDVSKKIKLTEKP
jgi:serine protease Do